MSDVSHAISQVYFWRLGAIPTRSRKTVSSSLQILSLGNIHFNDPLWCSGTKRLRVNIAVF